MQQMLVDEKPAVVSFHFGLPSADVIAELKRAGTVLLASATSVDEATQAADAGVDAIVAQGIEAGGHRGVFDPDAADDCLGTFALTRLLVDEGRLPVIAAGGIMDGAGIVAALARATGVATARAIGARDRSKRRAGALAPVLTTCRDGRSCTAGPSYGADAFSDALCLPTKGKGASAVPDSCRMQYASVPPTRGTAILTRSGDGKS